jgi:anti-anti-sigma factor
MSSRNAGSLIGCGEEIAFTVPSCVRDCLRNSMTVIQDVLERISIVHVEGPLRTPVSPSLQQEVEARLFRGERTLVIDLAGVNDIDAAGVGELVRVFNMAIGEGAVLRLTHVAPRIREVLQRLGLSLLLHEDA